MMRLRSFFSPSWGSLGPRSLDTMICIGGATSQWSWQSLMQAIGHGTPIDMISSYCNSAKTTSTWTFLYVPLISGTQHQHNLTLIKIIKCARSNIMIASDVLKFGSNMCHKRCCAHGADIPNLPNHITQYENHALMPKKLQYMNLYDSICISLRCRMLHVDRLGIMFYFLSPCAPEPCLYILWQLVARRGGQGVEGFNVFGDEGRCHASDAVG